MKWNIKGFFILGLFFFLFIHLTGCATNAVWKSHNGTKNYRKLSATSTQFFFSCSTEKCKRPKFLIQYKMINNNRENNGIFPPYAEGYIIIESMDSSSDLYEGLKILLEEPFKSKVTSITAKIRRLETMNNKHQDYMRVDVGVKLPLNTQNFDQLREKNNFKYTFITGKTPIDIRKRIMMEYIPPGTGCFILGGPSGGGPSGAAKIDFIRDIDKITNISTNDSWFSFIKGQNQYNIEIVFFEDKVEKVYHKTKTERALLTPLTIISDVVTSPFQIIAILTVPLWAPR